MFRAAQQVHNDTKGPAMQWLDCICVELGNRCWVTELGNRCLRVCQCVCLRVRVCSVSLTCHGVPVSHRPANVAFEDSIGFAKGVCEPLHTTNVEAACLRVVEVCFWPRVLVCAWARAWVCAHTQTVQADPR